MLERVPKFNFTAFEADTFGLKIDFHTESLFGYEAHIRNMGDDDEYMFSCRAVVDLMNPVYGQDLETAREGLSEFVLEWMRGIGREEQTIRAMSLLLQVPFGGECQIWHTDEDLEDDEVVYSILIPCHQQSASVFLTDIDPKFGPSGIKPLLSLGDMVFWDASAVTHAGSSSDRVPVGQLLRAAVFVSVGCKLPKPGVQMIHSGPDVEQWTKCVHPIIRCCVRCRRGVQACESDMKFCVDCLGSGEFQATAVVCRWCHASEDHLHLKTPFLHIGENTIVGAVWRGLQPVRGLCVHGSVRFEGMRLSDRLLLHFHEEELRRGFSFWAEFIVHYAPDETILKRGHRALDPEDEKPWNAFHRLFVQQRGVSRKRCPRSVQVLRVTSLICGFSSLFLPDSTQSSTGHIPVLSSLDKIATHSVAYVDAFRVAKSNVDRLVLDPDAGDRIERALLWLGTRVETAHCSCGTTAPFQASTPMSHHHKIQQCAGPSLSRNYKQLLDSDAAAKWNDVLFSHVRNEGMLFSFQF